MVLSRLSNQLLQSTMRNQFLLKSSASQAGNTLWFRSVATHSATSTARQNVAANGKFGDQMFPPEYSIFKGKAALSMKPLLPQFTKSDSGGIRVGRHGCIMLTFWPSIAERKYNWEKKQVFALSPTEVGSMINLGPRDSVEFFHDPSMKSSNAGQVRKSLSIKAQQDGNGYFFSLSVVNNILNINDRLSVPVTAAEFQVMRTTLSFALPHILGWHQYANQPAPSVLAKPSVSPLIMESEWDK